jgi:hypothetical protein
MLYDSNGDRIAVFSPAYNFGAPIELGTDIVNLRSDGQGDTIATLTPRYERSGFWLNAVAATLTAISVFLLVRYS